MTCRSCGAVIANKAIVCYRCGTATAEPATPVRAPASLDVARWTLVARLVAIVVVAWLAVRAPGWTGRAIWAVLAVSLAVSVAVSLRRR